MRVQEETNQQPSNEQTDDAANAEEVRPVSCIAQPVQRLCIAYCVAVSTDMNSIRARMVRTRMAGCSEMLDCADVNAYTRTNTHTCSYVLAREHSEDCLQSQRLQHLQDQQMEKTKEEMKRTCPVTKHLASTFNLYKHLYICANSRSGYQYVMLQKAEKHMRA